MRSSTSTYCDKHDKAKIKYGPSWRCNSCAGAAVSKRRRKVKVILVEEAGGQCVQCGYNKCVQALQFHHRHDEIKSFGIAASGCTRGIDKLREEAKKCDLLCANCHAETHWDIPR